MRAVAGSAWTGSTTTRIIADGGVLTGRHGCQAQDDGSVLLEDRPYHYRVAEIWFWMPAILAVGALLVAGLLLAGRFAERARDAGEVWRDGG